MAPIELALLAEGLRGCLAQLPMHVRVTARLISLLPMQCNQSVSAMVFGQRRLRNQLLLLMARSELAWLATGLCRVRSARPLMCMCAWAHLLQCELQCEQAAPSFGRRWMRLSVRRHRGQLLARGSKSSGDGVSDAPGACGTRWFEEQWLHLLKGSWGHQA